MAANLEQIQKIAKDIKDITIQGATNIAKSACKVMKDEIIQHRFANIKQLKTFIWQGAELLIEARSTEPMLFNAMKYAKHQFLLSRKQKLGLKEIQSATSNVFDEFLDLIVSNDKKIIETGSSLIKSGYTVFTHCHSGSVIKTLIRAHEKVKNFEVWNTETRPLYQGRKTSIDLINNGIKDTMVTDDSAPYFIDKTIDRDVEVDIVIIGCDAIKTNGNIINKVGSFSIAMSAYNSKIPLYIVGNLTKVDIKNTVKIEKRSGLELWPEAPKGLDIVNYAFDTIPSKYITGIITEFGIIKPKDIKKIIRKNYPWMKK